MYRPLFQLRDSDGPSEFGDLKRLVAEAAHRMTTSEVLELADMLHDQIRERRRHQFECDPSQPCEHAVR